MPAIKGVDTRSAKSKRLVGARRQIAVTLRSEGWTLADIGLVLNVRKERVRQMLLEDKRVMPLSQNRQWASDPDDELICNCDNPECTFRITIAEFRRNREG
jgi:hypothetical protein